MVYTKDGIRSYCGKFVLSIFDIILNVVSNVRLYQKVLNQRRSQRSKRRVEIGNERNKVDTTCVKSHLRREEE